MSDYYPTLVTATVDLYFRGSFEEISIAHRKLQLAELFKNRRMPLYGTYNKRRLEEGTALLPITASEVDFEITAFDWDKNTADIRVINANLENAHFDKMHLCAAYHVNSHFEITSFEYGFLEPKTNCDRLVHDFTTKLYDKQLFDFSNALIHIKAGLPLARKAWGNMRFVSLTPGISELAPEKIWSPANRAAAIKWGRASVTPYVTANERGEISGWSPSMEDLFADDWGICEHIHRAMTTGT